jgi:glycerophosphoryl diester phosphodiesterase
VAERQPWLCNLGPTGIEPQLSPAERRAYASGEVRIPTLRQVLELARELDLIVNIEIKALPRLYNGIAERVVAVVTDLGLVRSVLVSSFDHEQLLAVRRLSAGIATGVLSSARLARPAEYLALLDADAYHPGCHGDSDTLGFGSVTGQPDLGGLRQVQGAGGMVFAWTCNDPAAMATLCAAGATGVITDVPDRFLAVVAARRAP